MTRGRGRDAWNLKYDVWDGHQVAEPAPSCSVLFISTKAVIKSNHLKHLLCEVEIMLISSSHNSI